MPTKNSIKNAKERILAALERKPEFVYESHLWSNSMTKALEELVEEGIIEVHNETESIYVVKKGNNAN